MNTDYPHYRERRGGALPLVVAGAALVLTLYLVWDRAFPPSMHQPAEPRVVTPRGELANFEKSIIGVYQDNLASVVHITTPEVIVRTRSFYQRLPEGTGSGFVWDARGYVVTNYHVVQGRAEADILVRLHNHREYNARVVGYRADLDIAVLKLLEESGPLRPIPIGTSSDLQVGQTVLAIGNPFGLDHTLTTGVISALDRTIESVAKTPIRGVIQVDAAINPGNSGGPLLDSAGRLIGMNTAIKSPSGASAGIGFAVPIDTINRVVHKVIRGAKPVADRAMLGIVAQLVPVENSYVVMVAEVSKNSGAQAAGLRGEYRSQGTRRRYLGDVLLRVANREIRHPNDIPDALDKFKPGDHVEVEVLRGLPYRQERITLNVELRPSRDFR